jgi:hypothetical protein
MPDAVFNADLYSEDIDLEAKRAGGRDGKGALPNDFTRKRQKPPSNPPPHWHGSRSGLYSGAND